MTETSINLTARGKKMLHDDTALSPEHRLMLELVGRAPGIDGDLLAEFFDQIVANYGSADAGILALVSGEIRIELDEPPKGDDEVAA